MRLTEQTARVLIETGIIGGNPVTGPAWYGSGNSSQADHDHAINVALQALASRATTAVGEHSHDGRYVKDITIQK